MPQPKLSDNDFIRLFEEKGAAGLARETGLSERWIYGRRISLEGKIGRQLTSPVKKNNTRFDVAHDHRLTFQISDGIVLIGSDCHYWPGEPSLMHRAFVRFCKELKPKLVVLNGDVLDLGQISRHPPIGWEHGVTVAEEVETAQERLAEIERAAFKATKMWPLGNHDSRYETRLCVHAKEFVRVHGFRLRDHFPLWQPCWSVFINGNIVVKHRYRGGDSATRNNVIRSGMTMLTGHRHSAQVTPYTDYTGTRWGVDSGCIADPNHLAFVDYTEDNPKDWREAFCILTFRDNKLLWPELVTRFDATSVQFRGEVISV